MFNNYLSVERMIELEEKLVGEECQNTKEMKYVSGAHAICTNKKGDSEL